jgi:hypothetical protein
VPFDLNRRKPQGGTTLGARNRYRTVADRRDDDPPADGDRLIMCVVGPLATW